MVNKFTAYSVESYCLSIKIVSMRQIPSRYLKQDKNSNEEREENHIHRLTLLDSVFMIEKLSRCKFYHITAHP